MNEESEATPSPTFTPETPWLLSEGIDYYPSSCFGDNVGFFPTVGSAQLFLEQNPDWMRGWACVWNILTGEVVNV